MTWSTSHELNNSHFLIEKMITIGEWIVVGRVNSQGNSNSVQLYSYTDYSFSDASYRIRQVDIDGKSSFSKVIRPSCLGVSDIIEISPNPSFGLITVKLPTAAVNFLIVSSLGVTVKAGRILSTYSTLDISNLSSGIYTFMAILPDGSSQIKKITISR